MTEEEWRNAVAVWLVPYIGCKEGGTLHKQLIDIFNDSGLCTRYKMTYTDAWCATAASDPFIALGITSIFPCVECSCAEMITLAKKAGIWVEDDTYSPKVGDLILYDWDDKTGSTSDNVGTPDHVGIVTAITGTVFTVIEGNKSDTVGYRSMTVNGTYVRGYITPDYAAISDTTATTTTYGWQKDSLGWWWLDENGTYPANTWRLIPETDNPHIAHWYLFDMNGYMCTGWRRWNHQTIDQGEWYYLEDLGCEIEGACWHETDERIGALERWDVSV